MVRYSHLVLQLRFTLFLPSPHGLKASLQLVRLLSHWGGRALAAKLYRHFSGAIWPLAGAVLTPPASGRKRIKTAGGAMPAVYRRCPIHRIHRYTKYTAPTALQRCGLQDFFDHPASAPLQCESPRHRRGSLQALFLAL